jgi:AcrR family transcriptional regulator
MSRRYSNPTTDGTRVGSPPGPRRNPVQERSRQKVSWILDGAARVFARAGIRGTTNQIAEEAGVSIGTLYEYYPNKDSLLEALALRHVEDATTRVDDLLRCWREVLPGALDEIAADVVDLVVDANSENPSLHCLLASLSLQYPAVALRAGCLQGRLVDALALALRQISPDLDAHEQRAAILVSAIASTIHSGFRGTMRSCEFERGLSDHIHALAVGYLAKSVRPTVVQRSSGP